MTVHQYFCISTLNRRMYTPIIKDITTFVSRITFAKGRQSSLSSVLLSLDTGPGGDVPLAADDPCCPPGGAALGGGKLGDKIVPLWLEVLIELATIAMDSSDEFVVECKLFVYDMSGTSKFGGGKTGAISVPMVTPPLPFGDWGKSMLRNVGCDRVGCWKLLCCRFATEVDVMIGMARVPRSKSSSKLGAWNVWNTQNSIIKYCYMNIQLQNK